MTRMVKTGASRIIPSRDLFSLLNDVEQPGRYVGGEYGRIVKEETGLLRIALSFPDLYEIGMSNTAIRILYGLLNALPGVACERVFVPAPDFEKGLKEQNVPLYTLETGTPLYQCDILAVSFSYELLATNVLTLLETGNIPVDARERDESHPIVIFGGPGATNPAPWAFLVDAIWLGEAEAAFIPLVADMASLKRRGGSRADVLELLRNHRSVWYPGRSTVARREIWNGFGNDSFGAGYPIPSIPVIQDHGVVEIMRGCPQGCRFCHAGFYYRPYRMKEIDQILQEVDRLVNSLGYREISLSSLSSGDYGALPELMAILNQRYAHRGVSLQLPSLRVDSFTLPVLEQLNSVRRAGLTFAVESAGETAQRWTNKLVPLEKVTAIAREARHRGWRRAKLYFMIGLPGPNSSDETDRILAYVEELRKAVPIEYVVNVGTFVPKPHTPFQWEPQLDPEDAFLLFTRLKRAVPKGVSLRYHDPWMSWLEGVLSRGDERAGEVLRRAHREGARLDAWTDYLKIDVWKDAVQSVPGGDYGLGPFQEKDSLPWDGVSAGISRRRLWMERDRARAGELTEQCLPQCENPCGVCNATITVHDTVDDKAIGKDTGTAIGAAADLARAESGTTSSRDGSPGAAAQAPGRTNQLILEYRKEGSAAFLPHLAVIRVFERFWNRINLPVELSSGHHPKPKMSFGQPLPTGTASNQEIAVINLQNTIHLDNYSGKFFCDYALPEGITIMRVLSLKHNHNEKRIPAPMQLYGGSVFRVVHNGDDVDSDRDLGRFSDYCNSAGAVVDGGSDRSGLTVRIPSEAPGLGRILKDTGLRGAIRARRLAMYADNEETDLFAWYLQRCDSWIER